MTQSASLRIVVLISGAGTNLQSIINAIHDDGLPVEICAVISNEPSAAGLGRLPAYHIPAHIVDHRGFADRAQFDDALITAIDQYQPALVVLAGFMRRLGRVFVQHFADRLINIHPSLLPKYRGLGTHEKALAAKDKYHGTTIHVVDEALDSGAIICQSRLSVELDDDAYSLKTKTQQLEHRLYPLVLRYFAEERLIIRQGQPYFDGQPVLLGDEAFAVSL